MGSLSRGKAAEIGRSILRVAAAGLRTLIEAAVFAGAVALIVYLLPDKLPITLLALYAVICVWFFQLCAAGIALLALVKLAVGTGERAQAIATLLISAGFLLAVMLINNYILLLGQDWGRNLALDIDDMPLIRFLSVDNAAMAAVAGSIDGTATALLHLHHGPLQSLASSIGDAARHAGAALTAHASPPTARALSDLGFGMLTGLLLAVWLQMAKGREEQA